MKRDAERFNGNRIVVYCLDNNTDLNTIWKLASNGFFSRKELRQFYKLIGYSKSGYAGINFKSINGLYLEPLNFDFDTASVVSDLYMFQQSINNIIKVLNKITKKL